MLSSIRKLGSERQETLLSEQNLFFFFVRLKKKNCRESSRSQPVEEEVDRYGAQMPDSVSIQDPEHRGEIQELQQGQAMKEHHHQAALPPVRQRPPVLPAPAQPPQQVHHAFECNGGKTNSLNFGQRRNR